MTAAERYVPPNQKPLRQLQAWPAKPLIPGARIIGSAILQDGVIYWCPRPCRHHHVIWGKCEADGEGFDHDRAVQGFLSSDGQFLDREQAHALAIENGQCPEPDHVRELFSEDLW